MRLPPVTGNDWRVWAEDARRFLQRTMSQLASKDASAKASEDGVLLWDRVNGYPVVSRDGAFVPLLTGSDIYFIATKADLPAPSAGVITLEAGATYYFTEIVDLTGDRLVCGANTVILGSSSENSGITSTGLTGAALITSEWSLPMRNLQLEAAQIFDLDASGNAGQALDWYGVNLLNTSNIGTIANYSNFVANSMAFLNASGLTFDGTIGTIGFTGTLFSASSGTIITLPATLTVDRRFRIIYSAIIASGTATALNVSTSATIPSEGYILDTVNFSGGATYLTGVQSSDNKALFVNNRGVANSAAVAQYYMQNNATATTVASSGVAYKVAGTTTSSGLTERFTHTNNRATYSGALTRVFRVIATATVDTGIAGQNIGVYIAKNGTVIAESEQYVTTNAAGRLESVTVLTLTELVTNDYVEVFVENASSATNITVPFLNVVVEAAN